MMSWENLASQFNEMTAELAKDKGTCKLSLQEAEKSAVGGKARVGDSPRDTESTKLYKFNARSPTEKI